MKKRVKKFLKDYGNALKLAALICTPIFLSLYLFVPRFEYAQTQENSVTSEGLIMDALEGNSAIYCRISGETEGELYIEDGNIKISTRVQNVLYKNDKVYIWDTSSHSGKLIDIHKYTFAKTFINQAQIKKQIDRYKPVCEIAAIGSDRFGIPADVSFSDYTPDLSEIMEFR